MMTCLENMRKIIHASLVLILSPKHLLRGNNAGYQARLKGYCSSDVTEDVVAQTSYTMTVK